MAANLYRMKLTLGRALSLVMADRVLLSLQRKIFNNRYIRAVNYHDTPASTAQNFEKHLRFYQQHFSPVSLSDLDEFLDGKEWRKDRPGLIISFDDGHRNNYNVAAPLLEKYGFIGWFVIPAEFISTPPPEQEKFASAHSITYAETYDDDRIAMSWDELRELDRNHVIACHTKNHRRMFASTSAAGLDEEIVQSKHILEEKLQHRVDVFCWVGGEENTYSTAAARYIRKAGYRYSFMTNSAPILPGTDRFHLQRTNVAAGWHLEVIKFQLSGLIDILYTPKRNRVNRITSVA